MAKNKGKPSQKEMRALIEERLKAAPEISNYHVAHSLGCSPTTVQTVRAKLIKDLQIGIVDTRPANHSRFTKPLWVIHPYIRANPDIKAKNSSPRQLSAIRREGVLDFMEAKNLTSAVYAERLIRKEERAKLKSPLSGLTADDYEIFQADIHKGLKKIADNSVTHIVCDPTYSKDELLALLGSLGQVAQRVLTDDGVVLCMVGGSWLPDAMCVLGKHLRHWWQLAYISDRASPLIKERNVNTHVKWVLIYVKQGKQYTGSRFSDLIKPPPAVEGEREQHEAGWAQSIGGFMQLLDKFVVPSKHIVLDPFVGSGTTLLACAKLGIKGIGCDKSMRCVRDTRRRLDEEFKAMTAEREEDVDAEIE